MIFIKPLGWERWVRSEEGRKEGRKGLSILLILPTRQFKRCKIVVRAAVYGTGLQLFILFKAKRPVLDPPKVTLTRLAELVLNYPERILV